MTRPAAGRFVSRGGDKLDAALDAFAIDVTGRRILDAGASTGGFTDCLLSRGAAHVIAVDVAYGALAWALRNDPRVTVLERTNVRTLDRAAVGEPVSVVVADLAFISLVTVAPALLACASLDADLVLLVKPQFEVPKDRVERGGVVRDPALWHAAIARVAEAYRDRGCMLRGAVPSPLVGPAGNREFFVHIARNGTDAGDSPIDAAVEDAP